METTGSWLSLRAGQRKLATTMEDENADSVPDAAAAIGKDARMGEGCRRGLPRTRGHRAGDARGRRAGDRARRGRLRYDPQGDTAARRALALAAGAAGCAARRLLLPGADYPP